MIHTLLTTLWIDHATYYCASCGGWYPISHFNG